MHFGDARAGSQGKGALAQLGGYLGRAAQPGASSTGIDRDKVGMGRLAACKVNGAVLVVNREIGEEPVQAPALFA